MQCFLVIQGGWGGVIVRKTVQWEKILSQNFLKSEETARKIIYQKNDILNFNIKYYKKVMRQKRLGNIWKKIGKLW